MGIRVRPYLSEDREFLFSLASRLSIGMPPWRDEQRWMRAVAGWISGSIDQHGSKAMVFVAEDADGERLGFATVTDDTHFTGERQGYIGELVITETAEGRGVGKALVEACEAWAREQGVRILSLTAGAANSRALGFYHHLGYHDEDVKLVKLLYESD
jgi:GNAT superfamily N-acetyltransferase